MVDGRAGTAVSAGRADDPVTGVASECRNSIRCMVTGDGPVAAAGAAAGAGEEASVGLPQRASRVKFGRSAAQMTAVLSSSSSSSSTGSSSTGSASASGVPNASS